MKTSLMVGWVQPETLERVRAALHRPVAEAETATIYSTPKTGLVPMWALVDVGESTQVNPQAPVLYESELHPGLLVGEDGRYFRPASLNMILHCPKCGQQHVDAVEPNWDNPPHKTHLCAHCKHLWRPANVPTYGVKELGRGN